jgi:hypothetical protein
MYVPVISTTNIAIRILVQMPEQMRTYGKTRALADVQ